MADILTPNFFELQQIMGQSFTSMEEMTAAIVGSGRFLNQHLVVTSASFAGTPAGWIDIASLSAGRLRMERTPRVEVDPPGTGELFAAHLHLQMLRGTGFNAAITKAAQVMHAVLTKIKDENRREMALQDILASIGFAGR